MNSPLNYYQSILLKLSQRKLGHFGNFHLWTGTWPISQVKVLTITHCESNTHGVNVNVVTVNSRLNFIKTHCVNFHSVTIVLTARQNTQLWLASVVRCLSRIIRRVNFRNLFLIDLRRENFTHLSRASHVAQGLFSRRIEPKLKIYCEQLSQEPFFLSPLHPFRWFEISVNFHRWKLKLWQKSWKLATFVDDTLRKSSLFVRFSSIIQLKWWKFSQFVLGLTMN